MISRITTLQMNDPSYLVRFGVVRYLSQALISAEVDE